MASTAAELRVEAERWLARLGRNPRPLNRHLFLVPGITDEMAGCWQWIVSRGRQLIPNWDSYVTVVTFDAIGQGTTYPDADFTDFGAYLNALILQTCGPSGNSSAQFDIVCHSMGGLDAFAAFTPLLGRDTRLAPLPTARYFITLDTPWRGVLNWDIRCAQHDISDPRWPGRGTQCTSLRPGSAELTALLDARGTLAGAIERIVCMSADKESPIEVDWPSSNLCWDVAPAVTWPQGPSYSSYVIPGTCHSGIGGITWSAIAISRVFNHLLFNT